MKRFLSWLTTFILLFTTVLNVPCYSFSFYGSNATTDETITLSKSQFEEFQKKLDELDKQINPTIKQKILNFTKQSTKSISYNLVIAAIVAILAEKVGYVKLPRSIEELKNVQINSRTGADAFLGFLAGSCFGSLGNLFGFTDIGFLAGPTTAAVLSMYKTGEDPLAKTLEKVETANAIADSHLLNGVSSVYNYIRSWF